MAQTTFTDGQSVEVREGDKWSPAKVLSKEGRRYRIRYEGGTDEEWVANDRVRASGATAERAATTAPANTSKWTVGQEIEAKRALAWRTGKVQKLENGWVLVLYEPGGYKEWVEPWRIRERGSKEDAIGKTPINADVKGEEQAPKEAPSAGPAPGSGASSAQWKVGQNVQVKWGGLWRNAFIERKEGDWVNVSYDNGTFREWVEPWRIRKVGSDYDCDYASPNHFDTPPKTAPGAAPGAKGNAATGEEELPGFKVADLKAAKRLALTSTPNSKANLSPATPIAAKPATLNGTAGNPFPRHIVISCGASPIAAVLSRSDKDKDDSRIDRANLVEGKPLPTVTIAHSKDWKLAGVSADGATLLMRKKSWDAADSNEVELWQVDAGAKVTRTLSFKPYDGGGVTFAALTEDQRLLTLGKDQLTLWDPATAKAIWTCDASVQCEPAISPDGKHIAFVTGKDPIIIEIASGNVVAELPRTMALCKTLTFSPGAKQLMGIDATNIRVADLITGEMYREMGMPGDVRNESIGSPAEGWALINGSILVDVEKRIPVWKYSLPGFSCGTIAPWGQFLSAVDATDRACMLVPSMLPTAEATRAAKSVNADELLLLKPGSKITLQINVAMPDDERRRIVDHLNSQAKLNGFVFADNQPIQLVLSQEQGKTETRQYQKMGGPRFGPFAQPNNVETVTFTQQITRMRIVSEGKTAWEVSSYSGDPGMMLTMNAGQSAQDAANSRMRPYYGIFSQTPLPAYLAKPRDPAYLGTTEVTPRGVR